MADNPREGNALYNIMCQPIEPVSKLLGAATKLPTSSSVLQQLVGTPYTLHIHTSFSYHFNKTGSVGYFWVGALFWPDDQALGDLMNTVQVSGEIYMCMHTSQQWCRGRP